MIIACVTYVQRPGTELLPNLNTASDKSENKPLTTPKKVTHIVLGGSVRHPPLAHGVPAQRDTNRIGAGGYMGFARLCRMDLALADWLTGNGGRWRSQLIVTGGKGQYIQWVHCELIVGSETIHPAHTQQVNSGHIQKVPTHLPRPNPGGK